LACPNHDPARQQKLERAQLPALLADA
jgi:hypothetical protein